MSKKRVSEIAKELNEKYGIELDNKAVVHELQALGYDVKMHSSSLDDDQAAKAVLQLVEKKKPKAAPPAVAPKGFVVRRKVGDAVQSMVVQPGSQPPPGTHAPIAHAEPSAPVAAPVAHVEAPPVEQVPVAAPVVVEAKAAEVAAPVAPPVAVRTGGMPQFASLQSLTAPPPVVAKPAPVEVKAPEAPVAVVEAPVAVAAPVAVTPPARASAPRVLIRPSAPIAAGGVTAAPAPAPLPAPPQMVHAVPPTVRPHVPGTLRPSAPRVGAAPRPIGLGPAAVLPGSRPLHPIVAAPPRLVPTATQAVIVSRPLIAVKRVTPTQAPASRYPMAPGKKAIGAVREFKVVPGAVLPGREDPNKVKEKERRGSGRAAREKETQATSSDIRALVFGRIAIPVRGKKKKPTKKGQKTLITKMADDKKVIKVQEGISVNDLSQRMGVRTADLIRKLMAGGKMATANQMVDAETAGILAVNFGWTVMKVGMEVEDFMPKFEEKPEDFVSRPPVVTVMGHVDHGKTSLLDAIRAANVAQGEAGGITQHIGAYTVSSPKGDITFLDTPGHEAFSAMRSRGANITDVVVLVVAGDDGVMPQTKEAIAHAQKAEVPLVVAINKMDLPGANPDRVKKELADLALLAEDWGGEVIMVPVSAKTRQGLDLLLENIGLQAEVLELKANPTRPAQGTVLEARLEKGRGPVATVLVQEGTLRRGDAVVTGTHFGRVRMMLNSRGEQIDTVKPGYSAEVIGLSGVPTAGDVIHAVEDEKAAKSIADHRSLKLRQAEAGKTSRETLDDLLNKQKVADQKDLKVIIKADVSGSLEAVVDAVNKLSTKKVKVTIVQKGVGMMTETDINNAAAFGAVVLGFNSRPESGAEAAAKTHGVEWETFSIIYELLDGVIRRMEDLLEPIRQEKKLGKAEVRSLFNVPKLGVIAGSAVTEGVIKRAAHLRLWRANKQLFQGKVASLRRFKDDVKEVAQGYECGIGIEGFSDILAGDIIEAFEIEEIRPSLS